MRQSYPNIELFIPLSSSALYAALPVSGTTTNSSGLVRRLYICSLNRFIDAFSPAIIITGHGAISSVPAEPSGSHKYRDTGALLLHTAAGRGDCNSRILLPIHTRRRIQAGRNSYAKTVLIENTIPFRIAAQIIYCSFAIILFFIQ